MMKRRLFGLLLICFACAKPLPTLEGFDLQHWEADTNGCNRDRSAMREAINTQKEKLLGLDEVQTVRLLGPPDQNELYSRNQKFYYYFIEPAPSCGQQTDTAAERLIIRFNAVGLASEVSIE